MGLCSLFSPAHIGQALLPVRNLIRQLVLVAVCPREKSLKFLASHFHTLANALGEHALPEVLLHHVPYFFPEMGWNCGIDAPVAKDGEVVAWWHDEDEHAIAVFGAFHAQREESTGSRTEDGPLVITLQMHPDFAGGLPLSFRDGLHDAGFLVF